jgi:hypothetical protein
MRPESARPADRFHFYTLPTRMMRHILVDAARAHNAEERCSENKVQRDEKMEIGIGRETLDFVAATKP